MNEWFEQKHPPCTLTSLEAFHHRTWQSSTSWSQNFVPPPNSRNQKSQIDVDISTRLKIHNREMKWPGRIGRVHAINWCFQDVLVLESRTNEQLAHKTIYSSSFMNFIKIKLCFRLFQSWFSRMFGMRLSSALKKSWIKPSNSWYVVESRTVSTMAFLFTWSADWLGVDTIVK